MNGPHLRVIAGPNGAGKTTFVSEKFAARAEAEGFEIVNPDAIAEQLARIAGRLNERGAGEAAITRRNLLVERRADLAIETTLAGSSALRFMRRARDAGYAITLYYVGIDSPELSLNRVRRRVDDGGHSVPVTAISRRYADSLAKLAAALPMADRVFILDNSTSTRRLLLARDRNRLRSLSSNLPKWLTEAVPAEMRRWPPRSWDHAADVSRHR